MGLGAGLRRRESSSRMLYLCLQDVEEVSDHVLHVHDCAETVVHTSEHQEGGRFHLPGLQGSLGSQARKL